jgi:DNA-binding NtrC family response regulator
MGRPFPGISDAAMELLVRYDWPGNVRELRNLVESMVVLSPGKEIAPADIPKEIRNPGEYSRLLPVPVARPAEEMRAGEEGEGGDRPRIRPELEFVFRTLVDLRMDVDQLRREFDLYRDELDERLVAPQSSRFALPGTDGGIEVGVWEGRVGDASVVPSSEELPIGVEAGSDGVGDGRVLYQAGMTIEEMEAEAIRHVLLEVGGNRRKAAESLGIGERTLYRKIRKYGIEG